jgi:hypothetical protein
MMCPVYNTSLLKRILDYYEQRLNKAVEMGIPKAPDHPHYPVNRELVLRINTLQTGILYADALVAFMKDDDLFVYIARYVNSLFQKTSEEETQDEVMKALESCSTQENWAWKDLMVAMENFQANMITRKYHCFMWISSITWYVRLRLFLVVREGVYNVDRGKLEAYLQ